MKTVGKKSISSFLRILCIIGLILMIMASIGVVFAMVFEKVRNLISIAFKFEVFEFSYDPLIFTNYKIMFSLLGLMLSMCIVLYYGIRIFSELSKNKIFSRKIERDLKLTSIALLFLALFKGVFLSLAALYLEEYIGGLPDYIRISPKAFDRQILIISAILFIIHKIYKEALSIIEEHELTI
ncbi:DUF2975 domain-containing protein [Caloranaerobacter ferrireducens]|uniref:DUF2975 domain-containing protein n=1 Tax=Caloranaerobacter ferrireducens TaxID=1323370 RepID=UPI00084D7B65|nr:DUF2975 domain-containing protein [Caloranaerobacter ferrireducens]